ncbi:hypothetical protein [Methylomagnum sp.]
MNLRNAAIHAGLFLALLIPTTSFSADAPLLLTDAPLIVAKDEAKCEICLNKLTASCEKENKVCAEKNDPAACQAYLEKCKASVKSRCGGPTLCD